MEVVARSSAHVILDSCLHESTTYFANHEKILKCNPYCKNVKHLPEHDIFQWTFEVEDPRNNPIASVFFVKQIEETLVVDDRIHKKFASKGHDSENHNGTGKRIRWINVVETPEFEIINEHTFVGKADSEICLLHMDDNRTAVHFDIDISLDFTLSFPLSLMPEGVLKFMSEAIMSQIMKQALESMLCQVQSDICCSISDIAIEGGTR
jgi:hypothetical protein